MAVLSIERKPPVRFVKLDTGKRNVLGLDAIDALKDAISHDAEAPVVILSGRIDGFCAGLDNATLAKGEFEREELLARMGELLLAAMEGPTRIVAVCEGHAVAAGAMLLLVSDIRIGTHGDYKIGFTEPRLGMPLPELPALLARGRLDRRRLHELTALGRIVGPDEAAAVGFFDELTTANDVHGRAFERAVEIASLSDQAYAGSVASVWGHTIERIQALVDQQAARLDTVRGAKS